MASLVPYLTFIDGEASVRFLTQVLGFELVTQQKADDGTVVHAELKRGDAVIMGGAGNVPRGAAPGIYLVTDAVDDIHAAALAAGAKEVDGWAPHNTEWGTRRSRFVDLDGHEWSLGSYQPGQSW